MKNITVYGLAALAITTAVVLNKVMPPRVQTGPEFQSSKDLPVLQSIIDGDAAAIKSKPIYDKTIYLNGVTCLEYRDAAGEWKKYCARPSPKTGASAPTAG